MRKIIFSVTLSLLLLCGCRKTTYITRSEQLNLLTTGQSSSTSSSATTEASSHAEADTTADSVTSSPASEEATKSQTTSKKPPKATSGKNNSSSLNSTTKKDPTQSSAASGPDSNQTSQDNPTTSQNTVATTEAATLPEETTVPETSVPETTEVTSPEKDPYDLSNHTVGSMEYTIHALMNDQRTASGAPALSLDGYLCAIASVRAYEVSQYWSHNRLDGRSWDTVLGDYGYSVVTSAENLCQGTDGLDGNTVVSMWAGSESHRSNIVNSSFTRAGIGVFHDNGLVFVACLYAG